MLANRTFVAICLLAALMEAGANPWRRDYRCGGSYLVGGVVAECNANGTHPCCSPFNWCDVTAAHCRCSNCVDYRKVYGAPANLPTPAKLSMPAIIPAILPLQDANRWRSDFRCGGSYLVDGPDNTQVVAECNRDAPHHCCSPFNWCDNSPAHCDCRNCVDYKEVYRSPDKVEEPITGCRSPYQEVSDKCLLYSSDALAWDTAEQFCADNDGRLITFTSLDDLMKFVANLTLLEISEESNPSHDPTYWVGVSAVGRDVQEDQQFEWRWVVGDRGQEDATALELSLGDDRCSFLAPRSVSTISHDGDCSALKLPLCEHSTY